MNKTIRTTLCVAAALPLVVVLAGAARRPARSAAPGTLPTRACKGQVAAAEPGKLPVVQTSEDFGCLDEVASKFMTPGATVTQAFVPANPGCSSDPTGHPNATEVSVTAFNNAGNLDFDGDFKRKDGLVVAKVVNNSNCATRGIRLAPHHTYYWVVEHRGRDARLVSADDQIQLKKFTSCKADGFAADPARTEVRETVAMIKAVSADPRAGQCDHQHQPGGRHFARPDRNGPGDGMFHLVNDSRRPAFQDDRSWVVWMTCSADCCYAGI